MGLVGRGGDRIEKRCGVGGRGELVTIVVGNSWHQHPAACDPQHPVLSSKAHVCTGV